MQIFRKILCPVDFSEYSNLALRYASALAKDNQAELVIYHSIPDLTPAASYLEGNFMFTVHDALKSNAATKLDEYVSKIIHEDQKVTKIIGQGNPAESVLNISKTHLIDLVVMGTHGVSGYESFLMGSVTNRVLHKTTVPVLVVSKTSHHFIHEEDPAPVKIGKILCPIDLSMDNSWMAGITQSFAKKYDSEIIFLNVIHGGDSEWDYLENEVMKKLNILATPAREEECNIRLEVRAGDPENVILRTSEFENVDLIIMGHHTRKPIEEIFLGSVARRVVTNSKCPVLVARTLNDVIAQHKLLLL
jgi:nucleotide-binding universal stress UspA family protein